LPKWQLVATQLLDEMSKEAEMAKVVTKRDMVVIKVIAAFMGRESRRIRVHASPVGSAASRAPGFLQEPDFFNFTLIL